MTRLAYWIGMRRWPSCTNTIAAITPSARKGIITLKTGSGVVHQAWTPCGRPETIDAKIISEMPLPMPRWVISSPSHMTSTQPAVRQVTITKTVPGAEVVDDVGAGARVERAEEEDVADGLAEREADGQVARVLRDALLADLALLRSFSSDGTTTVSSWRMIEAVM